uniref:Association with the SNF1 complex (ASC) domain-containing protein n=1 Tax=Panagrolaimus sp. ES5 TaxID=591445 RepID=A0AC34GW00_9BILA
MGNQGSGMHKRERTGDRHRQPSTGFSSNAPPGASSHAQSALPPTADNRPTNHHRTETGDGCPVQMKIAKPDGPPDDIDFMDNNEFPVVFKWHANNPARHVYVTGSWDSWKRKVPLVKSTHDFSTILNLNPGRYEYKFLVDDFEKAPSPPVLPPHLLQVILNKDTPVHCDPNVLPEPNHVMLNHLYALSIKDGVMVLSATHRHRKKYVTTLLYKPINT